MCLPFIEHLIEGLNTRFNKYASMIYNMHAFVPSLVGMVGIRPWKLSTNTKMIYPLPEMSSNNTQDGKDNGNLFRRKIKSDFVKKALKMCDMDSNPNIYVLLKI